MKIAARSTAGNLARSVKKQVIALLNRRDPSGAFGIANPFQDGSACTIYIYLPTGDD